MLDLHGYALLDIERMAHAAVRTARGTGADYADRFDAAWHAIAELLTGSTDRPTGGDLMSAAWAAVNKLVKDELHHHGTAPGEDLGQVRRGFMRYWAPAAWAAPTPETAVVERVALGQIWPHLTPGEQRVLTALAVHEDYTAAAESLGLKYHSFAKQVRTGRLKFFALWHEGEIPAGTWGQDRRARPGGSNPDRPRQSVMVRHRIAARDRKWPAPSREIS